MGLHFLKLTLRENLWQTTWYRKKFQQLSKTNKTSTECQEYSQYVYVNEDSPVLSASPEHQSNKVSKCGIVETPLIVGGQRVDENEFPHMVSMPHWRRIEMNFIFGWNGTTCQRI